LPKGGIIPFFGKEACLPVGRAREDFLNIWPFTTGLLIYNIEKSALQLGPKKKTVLFKISHNCGIIVGITDIPEVRKDGTYTKSQLQHNHQDGD
jgi:hypothetical protein